MSTPICDFVRRYAGGGAVRLHMPGHKGCGPLGCEALDITEIDGADDLFHPEGIIARSEENAGAVFGAHTLYAAGGSTLCIQAMVQLLAVYARSRGAEAPAAGGTQCPQGIRQCRRSAGRAGEMALFGSGRGLLQRGRDPGAAGAGAGSQPGAGDGGVSHLPGLSGELPDVAALAAVCRRAGVLLAVDNAHGAYLKFLSPSRHPMDLGADLCCDSAHKTLPVVTGGAYLHIAHQAPELLHRQAKASMGLWGSSSPSYLILQSLDAANELLADYPEKLQALLPQLESLRRRLAAQGWELLSGEPLKVTLCPKGYGYTGPEVAAALESGGIYPEFYDPDHVVLMVSPQNDPAELRRLEEVLAALPRRQAIRQGPPPMPLTGAGGDAPMRPCSPRGRRCRWRRAGHRISAAGALGCPPAVPVVLCGQRIDAAAVEVLHYYGFHRCAVLTE